MSQSEATLGGATSDDSGDGSTEERMETESPCGETRPTPLTGDELVQTQVFIGLCMFHGCVQGIRQGKPLDTL